MQRAGFSILWVMALAGAAAAQTPAPAEPPAAPAPTPDAPSAPGALTAPELERRVGEALAAQHAALVGHKLRLRIERSGERWTASLLEASGRVAASTQVERLPDDGDAAVAAMTRAVIELDAQVARRVNEFKFQLMSVRFAPTYLANARLDRASRQWQLYRGSRTQELEAPEFFQLMGRDDLVSSYRRRRYIMYGAFAVAAAAFGTAAVLALGNESDFDTCGAAPGPDGQNCVNEHNRSSAPMLIALGVGVAGVAVGTYYHRSPQPIDEDDAKALADAYNRQLRGRLGLTAAARPPRLRDVTLAPYPRGAGGGLAVAGRFW